MDQAVIVEGNFPSFQVKRYHFLCFNEIITCLIRVELQA